MICSGLAAIKKAVCVSDEQIQRCVVMLRLQAGSGWR